MDSNHDDSSSDRSLDDLRKDIKDSSRCPCEFCSGIKRWSDNWCPRCGDHILEDGKWWENLDVCARCELGTGTMKIRLIDQSGASLGTARLVTSTYDPDGPRHLNACHARLDVGTTMPLWYGGHYTITDDPFSLNGMANIYFNLPSGREHIWGQGNSFETDAVRIHPDDLELLLLHGKYEAGAGEL